MFDAYEHREEKEIANERQARKLYLGGKEDE